MAWKKREGTAGRESKTVEKGGGEPKSGGERHGIVRIKVWDCEL